MKNVTPDNIRRFLLTRYYEPILPMQLTLAEIPDDFDLLLSGVIDSFGILEIGVVTKSVPSKTMVQGNPAQPIATVEIPLGFGVSLKEFAKGLRPIR
jgi:hypothetical protein